MVRGGFFHSHWLKFQQIKKLKCLVKIIKEDIL